MLSVVFGVFFVFFFRFYLSIRCIFIVIWEVGKRVVDCIKNRIVGMLRIAISLARFYP